MKSPPALCWWAFFVGEDLAKILSPWLKPWANQIIAFSKRSKKYSLP
jgi:hypothetical protein